ncbi:hypothetical protein BH11PLA2_BH11PLA2_49840 [soil metagenome]
MAKAATKAPVNEFPPEDDIRERTPTGNVVRTNVIAALGRPPGLYEVAVRSLWDNRYRVNVMIGADITNVHIAHSFFVEAGDNGDIISSQPLITKLY